MHKQRCLVLGSSGLVGYEVAKALLADGRNVRCVDQKVLDKAEQFHGAEYMIGDIYNTDFCDKALKDIDVVYDFISTTMPNSPDISLTEEINKTLKHVNYILFMMHKNAVKNYVFPSSGGAIYGSTDDTPVTEETELRPSTPYGVGKQISEDIIKYYNAKCGINAMIFRIGNVYGSSRYRDKPQGVIDVFIQNALQEKPIVLWGSAESVVRDYVFIDDVVNAIVTAAKKNFSGVEVYNVGTGIGHSVSDILKIITNNNIGFSVKENPMLASGVNKIVLCSEKLYKMCAWVPKTSLLDGMRLTIYYKKVAKQ